MADASAGNDPPKTSFFTRKLRRASFITATGERSRRTFTLREASHRLNGSAVAGESEPLLGSDSSSGSDRHVQTSYVGSILLVVQDYVRQAWEFAGSTMGQNILKCSLAYLLGSLATLVPAISGLFGHNQDSKHMVASVTVWFHPARTIGSMHEATVLAMIALLYAGFITFTSMGLTLFFGHHDLLVVGHAIVLVVFVGGGLGFIAWVKQHMGHPLVNVATSLASLGCITILIREGSIQTGIFSVDRASKVLAMVVLGVIFTTAVNVLLLPTLARRKLSEAMEKNTDSLGEMLISIARAFLSGREDFLENEDYQALTKEHQDSLNKLSKNLIEAQREQLLLGLERLYHVEASLVERLTGLSQDLGGLRSAAFAQFAFIRQEFGVDDSQALGRVSVLSSPAHSPSQEYPSYGSILGSITEDPESLDMSRRQSDALSTSQPSESVSGRKNVTLADRGSPRAGTEPSPYFPGFSATASMNSEQNDTNTSIPNITRSPGEMFLTFINQLGPPTKSLVFTLKQVLDELPFKKKPENVSHWNPWAGRRLEVAVNEQFHVSLDQAIELYRQSRKEALNTLYHSRAMTAAVTPRQGGKSTFGQRRYSGSGAPRVLSTPFLRQPDEVLADIEEVSACCGHFSFALLDFAEDVLKLLDTLEDLKREMANMKRSWYWLLFWRRNPETKVRVKTKAFHEHGEEHGLGYNIPIQIRKADAFADPEKVRQGKPWYYGLYRAFHFFRRHDIRFAIKVGIGAALYALPAFLEQTRPFFVYWRGEWGLVSYMAVCCMTIGASNTTGIKRFVGTFIGGALAILGWVLASDHGEANPWLLGFFGWLVSLGCYYLILAKDNGPMGRFILLTWNLGALYSYSLSVHDDDNDDDEGGIDPAIWDIVWHRIVAVCVGTLWGIIVSRFIWPTSARRKLGQGLCILWLRMGLIWKRDPLAMILLGAPQTEYMDIREEAELQSFLGSLKGLRAAARSEFELRGPFPDKVTGRMLDRTERMLDAFHAMNVVITKNMQCTPGEQALMRYTREERCALSGRISHLFTVLASSLKLQYPINDALPSIENSRDRVLARISDFRNTKDAKELATEQDYEMLYAYVLVTGQLAQDIQAVGNELESLFGTLNEDNLKLD